MVVHRPRHDSPAEREAIDARKRRQPRKARDRSHPQAPRQYGDCGSRDASNRRAILCIMRTTLDIDAALLDEAVRRLRTRTKRETVEMALREAISSRKRQQLRDLLGSFDLDLTQEDLERMRGES